MPGLFGIISFEQDSTRIDARIQQMCATLGHMPDYVVETERHAGLQSAIIGSIDLPFDRPHRQPVQVQSGRWSGFFFGGIYDSTARRRELLPDDVDVELSSDAQYLMELYLARGRDALEDVSGSFVAALVEAQTGKVVLLNDRYGLRPLYYSLGEEELVFAPEVKGVLAARPDARHRLDWISLGQFLSVDYFLGDRTPFEDVKVLPPATESVIADGTLKTTEYWDFHFEAAPELNDPAAQRDALAAALEEQIPRIALHQTEDLQVAALLSGGMDSRAIVGLVSEERDLVTHHYGLRDCPETPWAEAISRACGTDHQNHCIDPAVLPRAWPESVWMTEGGVGCNHFHFAGLTDAVARTCDVLLDGMSGDMLLGSHIGEWMLGTVDRETVIEKEWHYLTHDAPPIEEMFAGCGKARSGPEIAEAAFEDFVDGFSRCRERRAADWCDHFNVRNRQRRFIAIGQSHLSTRVRIPRPFWGNHLLDVLQGLPVEARYQRRAYIAALKVLLPELSQIPCSTDLDSRAETGTTDLRQWWERLNRRWRYRAARLMPRLVSPMPGSYPAYGYLLRTTWRGMAEALFTADDAALFEYVDRDLVRRTWREHLSGRTMATSFLFKLFTVHLWHQMFIEERAPDEASLP